MHAKLFADGISSDDYQKKVLKTWKFAFTATMSTFFNFQF